VNPAERAQYVVEVVRELVACAHPNAHAHALREGILWCGMCGALTT
jgi:hypothetical protein